MLVLKWKRFRAIYIKGPTIVIQKTAINQVVHKSSTVSSDLTISDERRCGIYNHYLESTIQALTELYIDSRDSQR